MKDHEGALVKALIAHLGGAGAGFACWLLYRDA